jgi:hypothetical protein
MKSSKIPPARLFTATLTLLENRSYKLTLAHIACETGLPKGWLSEFARNPSVNASVSRVELLHDYLSSQVKTND